MTIEQKAREIALIVAEDGGVSWSQEPYAAARLGIIEGLEMADQKLKVLMLGRRATRLRPRDADCNQHSLRCHAARNRPPRGRRTCEAVGTVAGFTAKHLRWA